MFLADQMDGLTRLAGPERVGALELWLLTRGDLTCLMRAVMDFLIGEIQAAAFLLAGRQAGKSGQTCDENRTIVCQR